MSTCTTRKGAAAFVDPMDCEQGLGDHQKRIYLCPSFDAQRYDAEERGRKLVHELAHLAHKSIVDHGIKGYGMGNCIDLAMKDPEIAQRNADNYAYFADRALAYAKTGDVDYEYSPNFDF